MHQCSNGWNTISFASLLPLRSDQWCFAMVHKQANHPPLGPGPGSWISLQLTACFALALLLESESETESKFLIKIKTVPFELREREKWNQSKWELRLITKKPLLPLPFSWTSPCGCGRGCGCGHWGGCGGGYGHCCGCSHSCGCWLRAQEEQKGRVEELKERNWEREKSGTKPNEGWIIAIVIAISISITRSRRRKRPSWQKLRKPKFLFQFSIIIFFQEFWSYFNSDLWPRKFQLYKKKMGKKLTSDKIKGFFNSHHFTLCSKLNLISTIYILS